MITPHMFSHVGTRTPLNIPSFFSDFFFAPPSDSARPRTSEPSSRIDARTPLLT